MSILLTGGTGFIGSHTAVELLNAGYRVVIIDDLSNSSIDIIDKIDQITSAQDKLAFYVCDVNDKDHLSEIFREENITSVIHFAAFKAVGESVEKPLKYYRNNIGGLITLLEVMSENDVKQLIFSSSATVYGNPETLPITESSPLSAINPYGRTKLWGEQILQDVSKADPEFQIILLRYFNPVGAHESGLIGESPNGIPNNLFPYILDVVKGKRDHLNIFGTDYDTPDGTGIRDYIHVVDLAQGHVSGLRHIQKVNGTEIYNLGTGKGYSVLDIVNAFNCTLDQKEDNRRVRYRFENRREGDAASVYANCYSAKDKLGWVASRDLNDMVKDSLNFLDRYNE